MARIIGITAGLNPTNTPERDEAIEQSRRKKEAKLKQPPKPSAFDRHPVGEILCDACKGQIGYATAKKALPSRCDHCRPFFARPFGVTTLTPEASLSRLAEIREQGWVMILRRGHFASRNGERYEVDAGDIFKVNRVGSDDIDTLAPCSKERTNRMFTVTLMIGGQELTQYPHEVGPITMTTVLQLQQASQIQMTYVSKDDDLGHFSPVPEMRQQIAAVFGSTVGM